MLQSNFMLILLLTILNYFLLFLNYEHKKMWKY